MQVDMNLRSSFNLCTLHTFFIDLFNENNLLRWIGNVFRSKHRSIFGCFGKKRSK